VFSDFILNFKSCARAWLSFKPTAVVGGTVKTTLGTPPSKATRKQAVDLQAAILTALRKRDGGTVVGDGAPARWRLVALE
jgi:hypothetical protein